MHPNQPPNQYSQSPLPPQVSYPPTGSGDNRVLWLVLGFIGTGFLLCSGFVVWVLVSFQSTGTMTAEYRETRGLINTAPPPGVTRALTEPGELKHPELASIKEMLIEVAESDVNDSEAIEQFIDIPRFVEEMERSGESLGVNWATRLVWVEQMRDSLTLPTLSEDPKVIGVEALPDPDEARATVISHWYGNDQPIVSLLYLTKRKGSWKLYDWRDVFEPLSDSQYFAIYTATPEGMDQSYSRLTFENLEIYEDFEATAEAKAKRTLAAYRKYRLPEKLVPLALDHSVSFLSLYNEVGPMEQLVSEMDPETMLGYEYYQSRLQLLKGNKTQAFQSAKTLIERLGWHPAAAIAAGMSAETAEQKSQAADWLLPSILIMPEHEFSMQYFLELAEPSHFQRLAQAISTREQALEDYVFLVEAFSSGAESGVVEQNRIALEQLDEAASAFPELAAAVVFGKYRQSAWSQDSQATMKAASKVLANPDLSNYHETVWRELVRLATRRGLMVEASELSPDPSRFAVGLRDELLSRWIDLDDWGSALKVLSSVPPDSLFAEQPETKVVLARIDLKTGRSAEALASTRGLLNAEAGLLKDLGEEPPAYLVTLLAVAAEASLAEGQLVAFAKSIENAELAFLAASEVAYAERDVKQLAELVAWYQKDASSPEVWGYYYQSALAYEQDDWEAADRSLVEAIDLAEFDERIPDDLPPILYYFAPDMEPSTLQAQRAEFAFRLGALDRLVQTVLAANSQWPDFGYDLGWQLEDFAAPELSGKIGALLTKSSEPGLRETGLAMQAEWYLFQDDWDSAISALISAAKSYQSDEEYYYYNSYLETAVNWMAETGRVDRLEELRSVTQDLELDLKLDAVAYGARGQHEELLNCIEQFQDSYAWAGWFSSPARILAWQKAGIWQELNAQHPVEFETLAYQFSANGTLFLKEPVSARLQQITEALTTQLEGLTELPKRHFPGSVHVWAGQCDRGTVMVVGYDGLPSAVESDSDLAVGMAQAAGSLCICVQPTQRLLPGAVALRKLIAAGGESLPECIAYYDYQASSWYESENWWRNLSAATDSGINPQSPVIDYRAWRSGAPEALVRQADDGVVLRVPMCLAVEEVPLQIESESGASKAIYVLQAASLAQPCLVKGTRVSITTPSP